MGQKQQSKIGPQPKRKKKKMKLVKALLVGGGALAGTELSWGHGLG